MQYNKPLRIAAFGFRSIPPKPGCAGADKFACELYPRLVRGGHHVVAYNRLYPGDNHVYKEYDGVRIVNLKTTAYKGFDTLLHSLQATLHIIFNNTADYVHIHNGGNSIWTFLLRLSGKKAFISQDGLDWKRDKWPWYGKIYLYLSTFTTAHFPNAVIFDNVFVKEEFEKKFEKKFHLIPYGSEIPEIKNDFSILKKFNLQPKEYLLFVGRFIPDKGIHYLIQAYNMIKTNKKLVLVGGMPNPSEYESNLREMADERVIFTGYVYGDDVNVLMKNSYEYIQPSDIEGLSPVILTIMGMGTPLICSDIKENLFAVENTALTFKKANINSLKETIEYALQYTEEIVSLAQTAKQRALTHFNWDKVTEQHVDLFFNSR